MLKFRIFWIIRTWHNPKFLKAASSEKWAPQYWQREQSLISSLRNAVSIWTVATAASGGGRSGSGSSSRSPLQWAGGGTPQQKRRANLPLCSCMGYIPWHHKLPGCCPQCSSPAVRARALPRLCSADLLSLWRRSRGFVLEKDKNPLRPVGRFVTSCKKLK